MNQNNDKSNSLSAAICFNTKTLHTNVAIVLDEIYKCVYSMKYQDYSMKQRISVSLNVGKR